MIGVVMRFPPFFNSDGEAAHAYIACGKVALNWGPVELTIERILIKLRAIHKTTLTEPMPLPFGRKVRAVKELVKLDSAHAGLAAMLSPLLGKAKELHAVRTDVVHSLCQGTDIDGVLVFGKSDQKRGVAYTEVRYAVAKIELAADEMRQLRAEMEDIFLALRTLS